MSSRYSSVLKHRFGHVEAFAFRAYQCMGHMDRDVRERTFTLSPKPKSAIVILQPFKILRSAFTESRIACGDGILRFERGEHVLERCNRENSRRKLLGTSIRIVNQINDCVCEFLKLRGGGGDFQPAKRP